MSVPEVSPEVAEQQIRLQAGAIYLDVRTVEEFVRGHPEGAFNIPVSCLDASRQHLLPNSEFLAIVQQHLSPQIPIYCGCASGQRSLQAAQLLRSAGYTNVYNVLAGFQGVRDPAGRMLVPGWEARGLPSGDGDGDELSYAALRAKARQHLGRGDQGG